MYTFNIKDNGPDINIVTTRAMLALAAVASVIFRNNQQVIINIVASTILVLAAIFVKMLFTKFGVTKMILIVAASLLLFVATGSITFAIILLLYGILVKFLYKKPGIEIATAGITIKKFLQRKLHPWSEFNNVILKDNLLTVDFKNNKLLQLEIDDTNGEINETTFNNFCNNLLKISN